jgi:group II intron reverse transcriptase/maturase
MLLFKAQKYLRIVRKRGEAKSELRRLYYNIATNKELFLKAYANLYANNGAMTPGIHPEDTVDGMSIKRIEFIMEKLKKRKYHWTPVRRTYIEKKNSSKKRPLGMPGFNDKILEEVLRMVLEAYYEPQFRKCSHGFRPRRGCHTALDAIAYWKGTRWFIEGDIKGCFDNLVHKVIIKILRRRIKDRAFLKLIEEMLEAGYVENWTYHNTYSGTPQGGIVSPLIANIVLNELDKFIEDEIVPQYTKGKARKFNMEYINLSKREQRARKRGDWKTAKKLRKQYTKLPSRLPSDRGFRRLWYVRYCDDFLLGLIGTKAEAETIKRKIKEFLKSIGLELSTQKTLITHARTGKARFLNYHINLMNSENKVSTIKSHAITGTHRRRTLNQQIYFSIPTDVTQKWLKKVEKRGRSHQRCELLNLSDYDIIATYEVELQGLINYYSRIHNLNQLRQLRYKWKQSLIKTLAAKYKTKMKKIRRKYERFTNGSKEKLIGVEIQRAHKKPLRAIFGKKPIQRHQGTVIRDTIQTIYIKRNELINRLLADVCELCRRKNVTLEGHHIRKLKDLKKQWKGREKPGWVQKMIAIKRKVLFVCSCCHQKIHSGLYDGSKLTQVSLESLVLGN